VAISGAATQSAAQSATQSAVDTNVVNDAVAVPATERYPGSVDPAQYGPGQYAPPGGPSGPVTGQYGEEPFTSTVPEQAPGGGYWDASFLTGTDGPSVPWDSSAGEPFAPSGAINPALHGEDLGATHVKQHVVPAAIGSLTRRTETGQTTVTVADTQTTKVDVAPNNRVNLDQYQDWNPDGYDPWTIPYSERPVLNNLAWNAVALQQVNTPYGVAGVLPDRSPYDAGLAVAYQAPPDPAVTTATPQANESVGAEWVL